MQCIDYRVIDDAVSTKVWNVTAKAVKGHDTRSASRGYSRSQLAARADRE